MPDRSTRTIVLALLLAAGVPALAQQDRGAALDAAFSEVIAAQRSLGEAESRREQGIAPLPGERLGVATPDGKPRSRLSDAYFERQKRLQHDVDEAQARYDAALKRWNDIR